MTAAEAHAQEARRAKASSTKSTKSTSKADRTYDAIVIGGGHNGLVNGAYLAKAGLKTLILERRHLVGGAAITEELRPGFWFTTFSYALSLLRPEIIHDLELTKHGFMPLLMSTTFAPDGEGDYLLFTQDHGQNQQEIARHSKHDADAYDQYSHDIEMVCQALKPLLDQVPPDIFSNDPEELLALASLGSRFRNMDKRVAPQRGPAADRLRRRLPRRLLRVRPAQGLSRELEHHRDEGRAALAGIRASCCSTTRSASTTASSGRGPSTSRATAGSPRCWPGRRESFGAEIRLESPVERRSSRRTARRSASRSTDGTEFYADTVGQRPRSAADLPRARRAARAARRPRREHPALPVPGHVIEGELRPRRPAAVPRPATGTSSVASRTSAPRWTTSSTPSTTRSTAGTASTRTSTWPSSRRSTRTWRPPASTSCRASSSTRPTSCARATGTPRRRTWATPSRRRWRGSSRDSATSSSSARSGRRSTSSGRSACSEGNIFAGEFFAPQMFFFRPAPGWSQYRTPIEGYYQCGSGTHPGGCVMGAPGKLAAGQILKDRAKVGTKSKA